jgi:hypothetical protein
MEPTERKDRFLASRQGNENKVSRVTASTNLAGLSLRKRSPSVSLYMPEKGG